MNKKNSEVIEKIKQYLNRLPPQGVEISALSARINDLITLNEEEKDIESPASCAVREYIAVRLIALFQTSVKEAIRLVVDYKDQKGDVLPEITEKISLEMVREFKNHTLTIGHFVSHLASISSVGQMASAVQAYLGLPINRLYEEVWKDRMIPVNAKDATFEVQMPQLEELFKTRNIICHEIGVPAPLTAKQINQWLSTTVIFGHGILFYAERLVGNTKKKATQ
jgi:hypothetical protein